MSIDETWLVGFVNDAISRGKTSAIDIGANCGDWTVALASVFLTVTAVEPDSRVFEQLRGRVSSMPDAKKAIAIHAAVSSLSGPLTLHMRQHSVQSSLSENHPIGAGDQSPAPIVSTEQVAAHTVDSVDRISRVWFGENIGPYFIKVDVEGTEIDVIRSASGEIARHSAWLVEAHDTADEVVSAFKAIGKGDIYVIDHPHASAHPGHKWIYAP